MPVGRYAAEAPPANRPGTPPLIVTWADPIYLAEFCSDIAALRPQVDIVVASCHWGLGREPLQYMTEIAHAAIDAGADIVMGHGPHAPLPIEIYRGKPVFYGLGNLTFSTGHGGRSHCGWVGMLVEVVLERAAIAACHFSFIRSTDNGESFVCRLADAAETFTDLDARSRSLGANLKAEDNAVHLVM